MNKRIVAGLAGLSLVLGLALTGCGASNSTSGTTGGSTASSVNKITIFAMAPQSGGSASLGQGIHNGAKLAFEDKKDALKAAGFEVTVKDFDDEGKPEVGTQLAQTIIDDKSILAGVGTLNSGVALPVSDKLKDVHVAMVSPANTKNSLTERGLANYNRIAGRDDVQGPSGAKFAQSVGVKTVFVVDDKTPYGQGLAEDFIKQAKALGMTVIGPEGINVGDTDFSAVLTRAKSANPDMIYFGGLYGEGGPMVKQARSAGITAKFMGGDGFDDPGFTKLAADASKGVYYTTVAADTKSTPGGQKFLADYKAKFNTDPGAYAAYGYDCAGVIIDALLRFAKDNPGKAPTRADLEKYIRNTHGFQGIMLKVDFDSKGDNKEAKFFTFQFVDSSYDNRVQK